MIQYDYTNQAWVLNGKYMACGHPKPCDSCFGTLHEGQEVDEAASIH